MAVQLTIPYETLVELITQLPEDQRQDLLHKLIQMSPQPKLTAAEKMALLRSIQIDRAVNEEPSPRRQDWYGDDGR
jgi:hypothetical protein